MGCLHLIFLKEKELESRINELYEELNEEKKTAVSAATSIAQLNWITEQVVIKYHIPALIKTNGNDF